MKLSGSRSILHVASARATFGKFLYPSQCLWLPIGLLFPPHSYRTKDGLWSPLGGREARRGPPYHPSASHGRRGGAERRALRLTLSSGLALLPHKYKFGLPPGTESANLPPFIPFFFARAAQAVLPR